MYGKTGLTSSGVAEAHIFCIRTQLNPCCPRRRCQRRSLTSPGYRFQSVPAPLLCHRCHPLLLSSLVSVSLASLCSCAALAIVVRGVPLRYLSASPSHRPRRLRPSSPFCPYHCHQWCSCPLLPYDPCHSLRRHRRPSDPCRPCHQRLRCCRVPSSPCLPFYHRLHYYCPLIPCFPDHC